MLCPSCSAELPDDAQFCIECGVSLRSAASTGRTIALPRETRVVEICRACGAANPDHAVFCVRCGHRLSEPAPTIGAPLGQPSLPTAPRRAAPGSARPAPPLPRHSRRSRAGWNAAGGAIFLICLGVLLLLKAPFFPAILVVAGITDFVRKAGTGRAAGGLRSLLWLFGIAFLFFMPKLFWPGILVLVGLNVLLDMVLRSRP